MATSVEHLGRAMRAWRRALARDALIYNVYDRVHRCWAAANGSAVHTLDAGLRLYGCTTCARTHLCRARLEVTRDEAVRDGFAQADACPLRTTPDGEYVCVFSGTLVDTGRRNVADSASYDDWLEQRASDWNDGTGGEWQECGGGGGHGAIRDAHSALERAQFSESGRDRAHAASALQYSRQHHSAVLGARRLIRYATEAAAEGGGGGGEGEGEVEDARPAKRRRIISASARAETRAQASAGGTPSHPRFRRFPPRLLQEQPIDTAHGEFLDGYQRRLRPTARDLRYWDWFHFAGPSLPRRLFEGLSTPLPASGTDAAGATELDDGSGRLGDEMQMAIGRESDGEGEEGEEGEEDETDSTAPASAPLVNYRRAHIQPLPAGVAARGALRPSSEQQLHLLMPPPPVRRPPPASPKHPVPAGERRITPAWHRRLRRRCFSALAWYRGVAHQGRLECFLRPPPPERVFPPAWMGRVRALIAALLAYAAPEAARLRAPPPHPLDDYVDVVSRWTRLVWLRRPAVDVEPITLVGLFFLHMALVPTTSADGHSVPRLLLAADPYAVALHRGGRVLERAFFGSDCALGQEDSTALVKRVTSDRRQSKAARASGSTLVVLSHRTHPPPKNRKQSKGKGGAGIVGVDAVVPPSAMKLEMAESPSAVVAAEAVDGGPLLPPQRYVAFAPSERCTPTKIADLAALFTDALCDTSHAGAWFMNWFHHEAFRCWPLPPPGVPHT